MWGLRHGRKSFVFCLLLAACGDGSSPTTPSPACAFAVSPLSHAFTSAGGSATVSVTTTPQCSWAAESASPWIALTSGGSGVGTGTVSFSVAANAGTQSRTSSLTVAGQAVAVTQDARAVEPCTFALSPDHAQAGKDAGAGTFAVSAPAECGWAAVSSTDWLTLVSGGTGSGNGLVAYSFTRNQGAIERTGTIAVANQTFRFTQQGDAGVCAYEVEPVTFAPCMPGGDVTAQVRTAAGCLWTATSSVGWLAIASGSSGQGSGPITIRFGDNYDAPRDGVVMVRWPTPTAGQNIRVAQAGCVYAVSREAVSVAAAGGTVTFDVLQQSQPTLCGGPLQDRCVWTARSDSPWIVVTTSMPRAGDDRVSISISANSGATSRTGRVTVRDKTVTVTQAAP